MTSLLPKSRRPDVTFHTDGRIDITARIARFLQLQRGDVIDIACHYGEYLLYVRLKNSQRVGRHEATVFPSNGGLRRSNNYRAHSKTLCEAIFKECSVPAGFVTGNKPLRLPAGSPVIFGPNGTAIPLITKNPL